MELVCYSEVNLNTEMQCAQHTCIEGYPEYYCSDAGRVEQCPADHVCKNGECLKKAVKSKAIERAFSSQSPDEVYERLQREMEDGHDG